MLYRLIYEIKFRSAKVKVSHQREQILHTDGPRYSKRFRVFHPNLAAQHGISPAQCLKEGWTGNRRFWVGAVWLVKLRFVRPNRLKLWFDVKADIYQEIGFAGSILHIMIHGSGSPSGLRLAVFICFHFDQVGEECSLHHHICRPLMIWVAVVHGIYQDDLRLVFSDFCNDLQQISFIGNKKTVGQVQLLSHSCPQELGRLHGLLGPLRRVAACAEFGFGQIQQADFSAQSDVVQQGSACCGFHVVGVG